MNRRELFQKSATLILFLSVNAQAKKSNNTPENGGLISPYLIWPQVKEEYGLLLFDLNKGDLKKIKVPFAIHKVSNHKNKPEIGYGISSYSNHIAVMNLKSGQIISTQKLNSKFVFSGHSQVSEDGTIYATVSKPDKKNRETGIVSISPATLKIQEEYIYNKTITNGSFHDLQYSSDEKTLITTGGSGLFFFDLNSKSIIRKEKIKFDLPDAILNHFAFTKSGHFGIQSNVFENDQANNTGLADKGSLVIYNNQSDKFVIHRKSGELAKKINQDLFGLCINNNGNILAVANPWNNYLTFWAFPSGELLKGIDCRGPTGITLTTNNKQFIVTTLEGLKYFNVETLDEAREYKNYKAEFQDIFGADGKWGRLFHSTALSV